MVRIVLVGCLPYNHGCSCSEHPYGCGIALIQAHGNGVGLLIRLHLVEKIHLAGHKVNDNGSDGYRDCFAAREYLSGETARQFDGALLRITEVFLCNSPNTSIRALYYRNRGYAYAEMVEMGAIGN
jgi:hypothetical protein